LIYESGQWEIDLARCELRARGKMIPVGGRAFEIIEILVQSAGQLVLKEDMMHRIWPGAMIDENTIHVHMSAVRKALGQDRGMLKTVSGRGFRRLGNWAARSAGETPSGGDVAAAPARVQPIPTNVPAATSQLIGRAGAIQRDLLSAYRAVTLTGPGGIGKTALALRVVRGLFSGFWGECHLSNWPRCPTPVWCHPPRLAFSA
jgi:DNA-binding winged helix-turn-helix (wHTH) protein